MFELLTSPSFAKIHIFSILFLATRRDPRKFPASTAVPVLAFPSSYLKVPISLRTQTYLRLSLVSAKNNVCEPEPGNDFCDVMTFVSPWPIRFHDRMKLECSQRIPRAVVLGLLELNCNWFKIPTSQKSIPGSGSQTLFSAEASDSRKYVCVPRLHNCLPCPNLVLKYHSETWRSRNCWISSKLM